MENAPIKAENFSPATTDNHAYISMIERLATNPDVDVAKLEKMMDLQERVLDRDAKQAFNSDMVAAQNAIAPIAHNQRNDQTNSGYADLKAVVNVAKPIYTNYGFALSFYQGETEKSDHIRICVDVMHRLGHTKTYYIDLHIDTQGIKGAANKTKIHGEGSTFSYGRRYLTCMIFHIPTGDDDDGNKAGGIQYLTDKQQHQMTDLLIGAYGDNQDDFFDYIGCKSVDRIPKKDFNKHKSALEAIISKRKAK